MKTAMMKKVHFRLSLLCSGITSLILLLMSLAALSISEKGLKDNSFISFQNDMNTLISNLEQQTVISHQWLTKLQNNKHYLIRLSDNDIPLLFNEKTTPRQQELLDFAMKTYETEFSTAASDFDHMISTVKFSFRMPKEKPSLYYGCAGLCRRGTGTLKVLVVMPQTQLLQQISRQRLLFFLLNLLAAACLMIFSRRFTGRLLQPVEEAQTQQTQFISAASHELRTPLAVILSCASACQNAEADRQEQFLNSILSEGKRMSKLIDDLLLLTRTDRQNFVLQKKSVEADTLLLETYEAFEPLASKKQIRLSVQLPEELLPPCVCDPERIRQVLAILLHNAISYTPEHGTIHLSLSFEKQRFCFQVSDNGIGIPDGEKSRIFERFYRADQSRSQKDHFGLGLSIAQEIVSAHRGQIMVKDTPGGGSTFLVFLNGQ